MIEGHKKILYEKNSYNNTESSTDESFKIYVLYIPAKMASIQPNIQRRGVKEQDGERDSRRQVNQLNLGDLRNCSGKYVWNGLPSQLQSVLSIVRNFSVNFDFVRKVKH